MTPNELKRSNREKAQRYRDRNRGLDAPKRKSGPETYATLCHPDREHVARGLCSACYAKYKRKANPEHARLQDRKFRQANKRNCYLRARRWYDSLSPDRRFLLKNSAIVKQYGITAREYLQRKANQDNKCAICGSTCKLHLDHNHDTNQLRDFICSPCNLTLGKIEKYGVDWVMKLLAYIDRWSANVPSRHCDNKRINLPHG